MKIETYMAEVRKVLKDADLLKHLTAEQLLKMEKNISEKCDLSKLPDEFPKETNKLEKKAVKIKNNGLIYQSNRFTMARYDFSERQKNIIYKILFAIKEPLKSKTEIKTNLFGDRVLVLKRKDLETYRNNLPRLKNDLRGIRDRSIDFTNNEGSYICTSVILEYKVEPRVPDVELHLSNYFIDMVRHGYKNFTAYQLGVAIAIKGVYAKRLYEICCSLKNYEKRYFHKKEIRIEKLKKMFGIEKKYKRRDNFERIVLKPAKERINNHPDSEVSFDYEFTRKEGNVYVILSITDKQAEAQKEIRELRAADDDFGTCMVYLSRFAKKHRTDGIALDLQNKGLLAKFNFVHQKKITDYNYKGGDDVAFGKIITTILKQDFGVDLKDYRRDGVGIQTEAEARRIKEKIAKNRPPDKDYFEGKQRELSDDPELRRKHEIVLGMREEKTDDSKTDDFKTPNELFENIFPKK